MKLFAGKNWIPRIKYGASLLEFTPAKAGAGMTKNLMARGMNNKGFTLIEIIILIVMASILLPAIIVPFVTGVKGSGKPEKVTTAMYLAHQRMEELTKFNYSNAALITRTLTAWANAGLPNYDYQYEILYVPNSDLMAAGSVTPPDTGYKRIRIRVRDPETDIYEVYSVVTNFPYP
jgi:type II secretory pathway pseudopilin PulG